MRFDEFKALPWNKQNDLVLPHLRNALARLREPTDTKDVTASILDDMDIEPTAEAGYLMGRILIRRFAKVYPDWASHDGDTFRAMGREMRRWRWHPVKVEWKPYAGGPPELLNAHLSPSGENLLCDAQWPDGYLEDECYWNRKLARPEPRLDGRNVILWDVMAAKFAELDGDGSDLFD